MNKLSLAAVALAAVFTTSANAGTHYTFSEAAYETAHGFYHKDGSQYTFNFLINQNKISFDSEFITLTEGNSLVSIYNKGLAGLQKKNAGFMKDDSLFTAEAGDVIHYTDADGETVRFFMTDSSMSNWSASADLSVVTFEKVSTAEYATVHHNVEAYHGVGATGLGFGIYNADLNSKAQIIAPSADFVEASTKAKKKNWSVKLQRNGQIDGMVEFDVNGDRANATENAAMAALIWHKNTSWDRSDFEANRASFTTNGNIDLNDIID